MMVNHSSITGPKMFPINPVPLRWTRNNPIKIRMLKGTTIGASCGESTFSPSTALSTEMAGVMTPSPYSSAAPISPTTRRDARQVPGRACRASSSARSATTPPSPRLSARMMRMAYFTEMIMISDQRISDTMPVAVSGDSDPPDSASCLNA